MVTLRVIIGILVVIGLLAGMSASVQAQSEENEAYANVVIDFYIGGNENIQNNPNDALGPVNKEQACRATDKGIVSLGGGHVVLDMGENEVILDETGNDFVVFEVGDDYYPCGKPEDYKVYISQGLDTWKFVGEGRGTTKFDISSTGLNWARYVKIVDTTSDVSGKTPGADIDSVKALYFGEPVPTLSLTKTATPQSIKQGQTTTITLTVKNTGSTEISDIEIADTIPSYLTFIDGEISKRYDSLAPKDTRQISYTLQFNDAGTFNLEPAIATYADDKGNYNTVKSKPASIEVIRSIIENSAPTPKPTNGNVQSASVHLHGEKTDVVMGEDILLKLAAVNLITKPTMHVQVIITPPSGMSVTSSEFVQSGAGLFTASYEIEPGVGRDIEVRMRSNQVGDFVVNGRIVYYFGDDMDNAEDHTLTLPITVRAEVEAGAGAEQTTVTSEPDGSSTPGFEAVVAAAGVLLVASLIKRRN